MTKRLTRTIQIAIALFSVLQLPLRAQGASNDLYVDADAPGGQTGLDWNNAFHTLDEALAAAVPGNRDKIRIAEGTYVPGIDPDTPSSLVPEIRDGEPVFLLVDQVELEGGYLGYPGGDLEQPDGVFENTVLSGWVSASDRRNHVVWAENLFASGGTNTATTIDGVKISHGRAGLGSNGKGAGLYAKNLALRLYRTLIKDNIADDLGGGVYFEQFPEPGILYVADCQFKNNNAAYGGALAHIGDPIKSEGNPTHIGNTVFRRNGRPAGLPAEFGPETLKGGAIYTDTSQAFAYNVLIHDNVAQEGGGVWAGAVGQAFSPAHEWRFATIAYNVSTGGVATAGGFHSPSAENIEIINSILWENTGGAGDLWAPSPNTTFRYTDVGAFVGATSGAGNLSVKPLFKDPAKRNLRLQVFSVVGGGGASPCIDAGASDSVSLGFDFADVNNDGFVTEINLDLDLTLRNLGANVDMGAYEAQLQGP